MIGYSKPETKNPKCRRKFLIEWKIHVLQMYKMVENDAIKYIESYETGYSWRKRNGLQNSARMQNHYRNYIILIFPQKNKTNH